MMVFCRNESKNLLICFLSNDFLEFFLILFFIEVMSMVSLVVDFLIVEVVKLLIYIMCVLFGVIGNFLVIIMLIKLRGKKICMIDFFLINLVIVDLGFLLLIFLMGVVRERVFLNWFFGKFVCFYF